ncbi:FdhF/YdeP family oxidoreductase [Frankia sp. CNm7]|uniref:FdhF/YdeP family oxidoreductase n=1 Tax=Frankia nepalensis TaxID=1836974 RepID=A0A937UP13_9ACTN|nr:FdhF/YdeP family oxidoreductase [Frankia nepalensis]MBL7500088.1 FdhF/YdeP family oxidoreductase [Frankia nepalensis]MBL7515973.1 FdhF/YdeP family oxidoreductase [Frankia nepalensis]MBL7523742.1 FdhF/YdeP family oxidoreductase [Frankia nepalensis]MBL7628592.1 FdhF/YdeP family oxidoreductase [Frankia nepalensis]
MARRAPAVDPEDSAQDAGRGPARSAAGLPGVAHALRQSWEQMGARRGVTTLRLLNQTDGFDCPGCAWPDPDPKHRHAAEFCENGAKAVAEEATLRRVTAAFFAEHSLTDLAGRSGYWLGQQGRLVEPMVRRAGSEHYVPVSWDEAFEIIATELAGLASPDEAVFYTSGRTSNEAAFLYQLFARAYGTNNLPDCSNLCHESSGAALNETIGIGKGSVTLEDLEMADLVLVVGQNPGTNHPRMLTSLEQVKRRGGSIVAVNPLPEASLRRFRNPQRPSGVLGAGTPLADQFLQIRLNGDLALFQALSRRLLDAEAAAPGTVLDHEFLTGHATGFDAFAAHLRTLDEADVAAATGLAAAEIDELARRVLAAQRIVVCWAMGLTQHANAVATIREVVNFLLLRGNIGRPGAGVCPVRGHSNVQGDRTMGIWEKMPDAFLVRLGAEFGFAPPRRHGHDVVDAIRAMRDGRAKVFIGLGGNFVAATPDTAVTEAAVGSCRLTVQISTKLNRSHAVTGQTALILPTLGRTEIDVQAGGPQVVTVEDSMSSVHASRGALPPAGPALRSEVAIVAGLAAATLARRVGQTGGPTAAAPASDASGRAEAPEAPAGVPAIDWTALAGDYRLIRERIANVIPGFDGYEEKIARPGGFLLPHPPRDAREFRTPSGRAVLTVNELTVLRVPPGHLLLQTIRSHDQYNTTIYGRDDRYRGVRGARRVVLVNPDDLAARGLADGDRVDLVGVWTDGVERRAADFRVVAYPTARECAAAYFPETNVLVPLDSTAKRSNTPTSKSLVVRLEPRD